MSKISLDLVKILLTTEEMKKVTGGSSGGNECWHRCYTLGEPQPTFTWYGNCYDAYHQCTQQGYIVSCGCNG